MGDQAGNWADDTARWFLNWNKQGSRWGSQSSAKGEEAQEETSPNPRPYNIFGAHFLVLTGANYIPI